MAKDPAFLMYSKDFLTDTSEMSASEVGVHIRFMCFQHTNGSLPANLKKLEKIALCDPDENFTEIWGNIRCKYSNIDGRFINRRLSLVVSERKVGGKKNRISSLFAVLIRESKLPKKTLTKIKKAFKTDDFISIPDNELRGVITKWFTDRSTIGAVNHSEDANENETGNGKELNWEDRDKFIKEFDIVSINNRNGKI